MAGGARVRQDRRGEPRARRSGEPVARSGGSLVAAASAPDGDEGGRRALESAHQGLLEIRYFLYLARRLGCLDLKKYKELAALQESRAARGGFALGRTLRDQVVTYAGLWRAPS